VNDPVRQPVGKTAAALVRGQQVRSADVGPRAFSAARLLKAMASLVPQPGREPDPLQRLPGADWSRSVLARETFELLLERERNLADRGTRLFTLIVLRRTSGHRASLQSLARQLRRRLRSTDVVGRLGDDRVGVLLSDTNPVEAAFLTSLVDSATAEHALELAATMFVYPSIQEAVERSRHRDDHRPPGADGAGGNGNENGNGHHRHPLDTRPPRPSRRLASDGRAQPSDPPAPGESRWPVRDLWSHFTVPTPLWKRGLDVAVSAVLLIALLPLLALVALAIRLDSPGPAIFRQTRVGRGGRPFDFFKFRSMRVGAETQRADLAALNERDGPVFKMRRDPRITRVGRVLRRWSLDELPQLWNVLRGDISLVGPRSPTPDEVPLYERWQRRRLCVTGGLTCTWQVSGRSEIPFQEWMRMDLRYIDRRGPLYDLWLLGRTVPAVLNGRGAH
jgi:lipopolysaccharide/colanic/teichoic acid biosynthesis glycosyltransferase/GGDEF domain-containing protein